MCYIKNGVRSGGKKKKLWIDGDSGDCGSSDGGSGGDGAR